MKRLSSYLTDAANRRAEASTARARESYARAQKLRLAKDIYDEASAVLDGADPDDLADIEARIKESNRLAAQADYLRRDDV
ncbi:hypothetical protein [Streptomyces sp. SCSIO ZS0520]|uniref:hypothetical protein n=1 Tax=Streptomyces sp. SCSIO ZS0520 TaxID=2892996 RepID=UPI0021D9E961|nr:hypothetical protein [Streptomyces sp. SCSIO ZS0520]